MRGWLKTALSGAIGIFVVAGMAAPASATPSGLTDVKSYSNVPWEGNITGFYQHFDTVETYLDSYFGQSDVDFLAFVYNHTLYPDASLAHAGLSVGGDLTGTSGNWTFNNGDTTYKVVAIELMVVGGTDRRGNELLNTIVYSVNDLLSMGSNWDTSDFLAQNGMVCKISSSKANKKCPDLLKIAFYGEAVSTPEPASIALFTAGLAGLGLRRRKRARISSTL